MSDSTNLIDLKFVSDFPAREAHPSSEWRSGGAENQTCRGEESGQRFTILVNCYVARSDL